MDLIDMHLYAGGLLMAVLTAAVLGAWTPDQTLTEVMAASVRENPASYRPSYTTMTGWHPVYTSSGGGYRTGVSVGGGYTSGK